MIVAIIADYLRLQWNHLNLEEESAFGVLDLELTACDWERVEASDPLFGNLSRQRFAGIFGQLGL